MTMKRFFTFLVCCLLLGLGLFGLCGLTAFFSVEE